MGVQMCLRFPWLWRACCRGLGVGRRWWRKRRRIPGFVSGVGRGKVTPAESYATPSTKRAKRCLPFGFGAETPISNLAQKLAATGHTVGAPAAGPAVDDDDISETGSPPPKIVSQAPRRVAPGKAKRLLPRPSLAQPVSATLPMQPAVVEDEIESDWEGPTPSNTGPFERPLGPAATSSWLDSLTSRAASLDPPAKRQKIRRCRECLGSPYSGSDAGVWERRLLNAIDASSSSESLDLLVSLAAPSPPISSAVCCGVDVAGLSTKVF